jgi:putative DNA primase/helicase
MDLEEIGETFGMEDMIDKTTAIIGDARLEGRGAHKLVTRLLSISGQDAITVNRKNEKKWHGTLGVRFLILTNPAAAFHGCQRRHRQSVYPGAVHGEL